MLEDDLFKVEEDMLVDEILGIIIGSTQTNKITILNLLYFIH